MHARAKKFGLKFFRVYVYESSQVDISEAATTTTFCSANICTEHPEGVPRGLFSLCERIQVQLENKDHYRSNDGRDGTQGEEGRERQEEKIVSPKG